MPAGSTPGSPLCQHHKAETLVIPASPRGIPEGSPTEDSSQAQLTHAGQTPAGLRWMGSATRALCLVQCHPWLFLSTTQALSLSGLDPEQLI